ncbi:hypothetical protein BC830DRAFT_1117660 [Chytriomyces sp. MP71]|nr:hypothetical protein BC830DRAFT_1117660 [Chytriomyces sp. MP71]
MISIKSLVFVALAIEVVQCLPFPEAKKAKGHAHKSTKALAAHTPNKADAHHKGAMSECTTTTTKATSETTSKCTTTSTSECDEPTTTSSQCDEPTPTHTYCPPQPTITPNASGCQALWGKCGGEGWTGPTDCDVGATCVYQSKWYSQCQPAQYHGECGQAWAQCGGQGYAGSTCCAPGNTCVYMSKWYSECKPSSQAGAAAVTQDSTDSSSGTCGLWDQCGGAGWTGRTLCPVGSTCVTQDEWYSQCQPAKDESACADSWAQCGGSDYSGSTCCATGNQCVYQSKWYSECKPM